MAISTLILFAALMPVQKAPILDIPTSGWAELFFVPVTDPQSINGRAKASNLQDLQKKGLPVGVTEVRIWEGFGLTYLEGYRFRYENKRWRGWWIQPLRKDRPAWKATNYVLEFKPPEQGWDAFWKAMVSNDLPTLPDFKSLPGDKNDVLDGVAYVVEYAVTGKYRTYLYSNPQSQRGNWPELQKLRTIVKEIHNSFRDQTN